MSQIVLQIVLAGLAMGAVYALVALGFTLIWNAVAVVNFAQGDFVMLGAFVGVGWMVNALHAPIAIQVAAIVAFMALVGLAVAAGLYHPLRRAPQLAVVAATLGLSMFLQNVVVLVWGPQPLFFGGPLGTGTVELFGARIYAQYLLILATLIALMAGQEAVFRLTSLGRAMRATAQDAEAARLMGVRTSWMIAATFAYSAVLAGIAGWLVAPLFYVSAEMGVTLSLKAFAATILGGFGSVPGALVGGLLLGVIESTGSFYISSEYADVVAFGVLSAALLFRPQGIFGEPAALERP